MPRESPCLARGFDGLGLDRFLRAGLLAVRVGGVVEGGRIALWEREGGGGTGLVMRSVGPFTI